MNPDLSCRLDIYISFSLKHGESSFWFISCSCQSFIKNIYTATVVKTVEQTPLQARPNLHHRKLTQHVFSASVYPPSVQRELDLIPSHT